MDNQQIIEADWTFTGEKFERDIQVVVSGEGIIEQVSGLDLRPTRRLERRALIPGMINAHSHAFQRGLRGRTETFPDQSGSFWSWREAMYGLVESLDADGLYRLSLQAFGEMLAGGITTVGEFHYLHHPAEASDYSLDETVLNAARDAGIRIVFLNVFYKTGGIGQPLDGGQKRFATASVDDFLARIQRLEEHVSPATQSLGIAAHSIRAVPVEDLKRLHQFARNHDMVFHMHVEEQQKEIAECRAAYGSAPMRLLLDELKIDERFTAIHCTHTAPDDLRGFVQAGGNVCLCPTTEANLGDGICDLPLLREAGGHVCVGTDSNSVISMTEELRWLEYVQRLRSEVRGVCLDESGSVGGALFEAATVNGARSLGVSVGRIAAGCCADLVALDLTCETLAGWTPETLLDAFIFGSGREAVAETCVAGRWSPVR